MSDQSESPTIEEIQADFIRAVREGDRVTVSKVNAIGGWDSSHFNARGIQVYADELDRLRAENARLREALEKADVTIKTADALAEAVGLVISTTDPRVYLQAFDGVRVSHDAYRKSRAALQTKGDE